MKKSVIRKVGRILLIILSIVIAFNFCAFLFVALVWIGALNFMDPHEIATYDSPDGNYSLVFEQLGAPAWPYGPTDVRLTLKNQDGKVIKRVRTVVYNDGTSATEGNIVSVSWHDDHVIVILEGYDSGEEVFSIAYKKESGLRRLLKSCFAKSSATAGLFVFLFTFGEFCDIM